MSLNISKQLSLPEDTITQTFAILAKRGVGKTYTASVMVEEMLKHNLPVVVLDPIGVWWGLRSSADGKGAGMSIIIAGGDHADVPISPDNGEIVANLVVNEKLSVVIDLSHFRKGEQTRFVQDFAETLYHNNRSALHIVLDEADAFAPQRPMPGQQRMLGAIEDLVRRGRARGLGVTLITQRPAVLNKDVLTQIEVLVAMRLVSPQDRKAIDEWVKVHGEEGQREELMASLPSLPIGTAWFWSPGWLDMFRRVEIRKRETLDSSSTPKVGKVKVEPRKMAKVDLEKIREKLSLTIEKAEANDPKVLRTTIIKLERQLAQQKPQVEIKEVPVISDEQFKKLEELGLSIVANYQDFIEAFEKVARISNQEILRPPTKRSFTSPNVNKTTEVRPMSELPPMQISNSESAGVDRPVTGGAQRMLDVLGSRYPMTFTKSQLAALSKMSPRSGTFGTYMSTLRSNGLITQDGNQISLTEKGKAHVGDVSAVPQSTDQVIDMWRNNLTGGAQRMFNTLIKYYPSWVNKNDLGQAAEISHSSGTFGTYMSMLRRNGLIEVSNGEVRASDSLFAIGDK